MGGIIDVGIRDPKTDGYHGMADVNLIDASFIVEGPVGKRGAFALAAQAQLHRLLVQERHPRGRHRRHRGARLLRLPGGLHLPPRERRQGAHHVLRLGRRVPAEPEAARRRRSDAAREPRPGHRPSAGCRPSGSAAWARTSSRRSAPASGRSNRICPSATTLGFSFNGFDQFLRAEWRAQLGSHVKLIGGFDGYAVELDVSYVGPIAQSTEGNPRYFSGPLTGLPTATFKGPFRSYRPAGYLEALIQAGERLTLVPGVRVDYYSEIEKGSVNPRLTARFKLAPQTTLKGGVGLFSQPPLYGENVAPIGNPNLGLSRAQHYGLGVEQRFGAVGSVSLEGFYKRLSDLEVNGVGPDGNPLLVNGGKGRIYGLELLAKLNPTGRAFGFVSYTLSRSERNDYGAAWRLFDFDQTHILTLMGGYQAGPRLGLRRHLPPGQRQPAHADRRQRLRRQQRLLQPDLRRA